MSHTQRPVLLMVTLGLGCLALWAGMAAVDAQPAVNPFETDLNSARSIRGQLVQLLGDPARNPWPADLVFDDSSGWNPNDHWTLKGAATLRQIADNLENSGKVPGGWQHLVQFRNERLAIAATLRPICVDLGGDKTLALRSIVRARREVLAQMDGIIQTCEARIKALQTAAASPSPAASPSLSVTPSPVPSVASNPPSSPAPSPAVTLLGTGSGEGPTTPPQPVVTLTPLSKVEQEDLPSRYRGGENTAFVSTDGRWVEVRKASDGELVAHIPASEIRRGIYRDLPELKPDSAVPANLLPPQYRTDQYIARVSVNRRSVLVLQRGTNQLVGQLPIEEVKGRRYMRN